MLGLLESGGQCRLCGCRCCVSADLELVDKFCYLGVMLSVDGDADAAVDGNKFGQLS